MNLGEFTIGIMAVLPLEPVLPFGISNQNAFGAVAVVVLSHVLYRVSLLLTPKAQTNKPPSRFQQLQIFPTSREFQRYLALFLLQVISSSSVTTMPLYVNPGGANTGHPSSKSVLETHALWS